MSDVTRILTRIEQGDSTAADQLLPLVYDELKKLAAVRLAAERPGQTLSATSLVHEAYIRLVEPVSGGREAPGPSDSRSLTWDSRGHFFPPAAEAMRRILVEAARSKASAKRGGDFQRIELSEVARTASGDRLNL